MREFNIQNINELIEFIKATDDLILLKEKLSTLHEYELSELFKTLSEFDLVKVYSIFSDEELGNILTYIDSEDAAEIIENLNSIQIANIINTMEPDDAIDIIQEFEEDKQEEIINLLDEDQKIEVGELSRYPENTAGAIMNTNYISIESDSDIKKIMKEIVSRAADVESINTSFVIDSNGTLLGTLDLKKIIVTKSPTKVDEIMNPNFKYLEVGSSLDETTEFIRKYDVYELPVLENGILKGIITMDDALDTFYEEAKEDYAKFGGVSESLDADDTILISVKNRLPWLTLLLVFNIVIALVISNFGYLLEVEALSILVVFQPIILGLAGNSGTQSLGITISEITKNELNTKNKILVHVIKEVLLGIVTGLILSLISTFIAYIVLNNTNSVLNILDVIITVSVSLSISVVSANLFGTIIPIIFYKIKIDPAAASGPLITTTIDIIAVIIYYSIATILLYNKLI